MVNGLASKPTGEAKCFKVCTGGLHWAIMENSMAAPSLLDPVLGQNLGISQYEFRTKPSTRFIIIFQFRKDITAEFRIILSYQTWLVTSEIRRKIQTFFNRCLRYILRIWWPNVISNKDLWRVTDQEDINLEIIERKHRWIGHTLRKKDGEIPKAALLWNPQESRKRGRPKNRWRRLVIKEVGRSWSELRFLAADRQKRKELIYNLCS